MTPAQKTKYNSIPSIKKISKTVNSFKKNGFLPILVNTKEEALDKIRELIPDKSSIMNGTSTTLKEIGFVDFLKKNKHNWVNLHEKVISEKDPEKQAKLRKHSVISDYYIGSAHAVTENGELLIASNTGSQLPHLVYTSQNIILVVGAQKITKDLSDAFQRLEKHVIPLEDKRMNDAYGFGTTHAKSLILHKENPMIGRKIYIIIVGERLGF